MISGLARRIEALSRRLSERRERAEEPRVNASERGERETKSAFQGEGRER